MSDQLIDKYGPVLQLYGIIPEFIEDRGKIKKIYSQGRAFALKEMNQKHGRFFSLTKTLELFKEKGFNQYVPTIKTEDNNNIAFFQNHYYYVMPWIEESQERFHGRHSTYLEGLSQLHHSTVIEQSIKEDIIQNRYDELLRKWENRKYKFLSFQEHCEKKVYMSPFELFFCLNVPQIMRMDEMSKQRLGSWLSSIQDDKKERFVLCHGKANPSHILNGQNEGNLLINFERSYLGTPINDIVYFLRRSLFINPNYRNQVARDLNIYQAHFPLRKAEIHLLFAYLLQADSIYRTIIMYNENTLSELEKVRKLHKEIQLMQMSHYLVSEIETDQVEEEKQSDE